MQVNTIHIPHQNGELIVNIKENYEAVLCDYIGNAEILYLPSTVSFVDEFGNESEHEVSSKIPDDAFGSCDKTEVIVINHYFEFGLFVFQNCYDLSEIIEVDAGCSIDEFSFTNEGFCPKKMRILSVHADECWPHDQDGDDILDLLKCQKALQTLVAECVNSNDLNRLHSITELLDVNGAIDAAITSNDICRLEYIESLGFSLDQNSPFTLCTTDAIKEKAWDAFDFLLSRGIIRARWEYGSVIYCAMGPGTFSVELIRRVLAAGASPFSKSPEWDGERLVSDVAKEKGYNDIYNILIEAQNNASV